MKCIYTLMLSICAATLHAQKPTLVEDTWPGPQGSNPGCLTVYNGKLYFAATDSAHGRELWEYQSANGARMVADTRPGKDEGVSHPAEEAMPILNGKLHFSGHPIKVWRFDGASPTRLDSFAVPNANLVSRSFAGLGSRLYFHAGDAANSGLFSCGVSGSAAQHIDMDPSNYNKNWMPLLAPYKGKLYFSGDTRELCYFDPALSQGGMVTKINGAKRPGQYSSPRMFLVAGDRLYFAATDSATGQELYQFDGMAVKRLTDIGPGPADGIQGQVYAGNMACYKGGIFFEAGVTGMQRGLYRWDTATGATTKVHDFSGGNGTIRVFHVTGVHLYFYARTAASGYELWRYDGNVCTMVADLNPGSKDGVGFSNFATYEGMMYFSGDNGVTGKELYRIADHAAGIQSAAWNGALSIFPNPAVSSVVLDIKLPQAQTLHIRLTDVSGRQVFTSGLQHYPAGSSRVDIPLQSLAAGQYFYRLSGRDGELLASGGIVRQ